MKHPITLCVLSASLVLAGAAGPSWAQSSTATGTVEVTGSVANRCLFVTGDVVLDLGELALLSGDASAIGRLDGTKLTSRTATLNGWCNGVAAEMAVEAFPLLNTSFTDTPPTGFDRRIDYTATATASPSSGAVSANDTTLSSGQGSSTTTGIFSSDITVTFTDPTAPGGGRLISGPYSGSVVVTLSPSD